MHVFGGPTAYLFLLDGERYALQRRILSLDNGGVEAVVVLSEAGGCQPLAVRADDDDSLLNPFVCACERQRETYEMDDYRVLVLRCLPSPCVRVHGERE